MTCFQRSIPMLKALCDETRLKIMSMLATGEMGACGIHKAVGCTQPTISYHMHVLLDSELVLCRREGCQCIYSVNPRIWPSVEALLKELCRDIQAEGDDGDE